MTDLVSTGQPVGQLLQAPHHPLVPEVVWEGLRPLCQQLEDLGSGLPDSHLTMQGKHRSTELTVGRTKGMCKCLDLVVGSQPCRNTIFH